VLIMFKHNKKFGRTRNSLIILTVAVFIAAVGIIGGLRLWYANNLRPVSSSQTSKYFTVEQGIGVHEIAVGLKKSGIIRSSGAFETYVRGNEYAEKLQAGTYSLAPSLSVQEIVNKMLDGDVAKNLLTILPGKNLEQVKHAFKKQGYSDDQIKKAFDADQYRNLAVLSSLPAGASLEGYLYPDSFQKLVDTPAEAIISQSLEEMQTHLNKAVLRGFKAQGLNPYQGIILASIIEKEVPSSADKPVVAQIFLSRMQQGIKLESDATTSVYNTYENPGLPPKPISNVTDSSLDSVARPAKTDYLFFVSGDDGKTHFSKTKQEHDANIQKYCKIKCGG
jgi:UPF0755 protein